MSFDTIAAAVATLLSATLATMILARGWGTRRAHLLAWGTSLGLFAVGSATLTFGSATSWTPALFRLYYAAGAVLTVPFLGLGSVWLHSGGRSPLMSCPRARSFSAHGLALSRSWGTSSARSLSSVEPCDRSCASPPAGTVGSKPIAGCSRRTC